MKFLSLLGQLGLVVFGLSSCAHSTTLSSSPLKIQLEDIRAESKPLHPKSQFTPAEKAYVAHYGLDQLESIDHQFGFRDCGDSRIAFHWFEPPSPKRIVVVSHGYYDHTGTWKHAIRALLEAGNTVVIYDQPGHGLSDGERASIDDFREYVDVFEEILEYCQNRARLPIVLAGHSMGCAVITEYLLKRDRAFEPPRTVFVAPLIRSAFWGPSKFGQAVLGWAVPSVPRVFMENSSDPEYLEFVRQDPLHHRRVPLDWTRALVAWNERAVDFVPAEGRPVRILQGARDGTVDWDYNLKFLDSKFPDASVRMFPEGNHQLLNEAEPLRSEVLQELVDAVGGSPGL